MGLRASVGIATIILVGCGDNRAPAAPDASIDAPSTDAPVAHAIAARPIAPLSTATVTSLRPTLRWELAPGTDGARVELCLDRACTRSLATLDVLGTSIAPTADLPHGPVYWRLHGRAGSEVGALASATWEIFVGVRGTAVDTSWGTTLDVDGDGLADIAVGAPSADNQSGRADVYLGTPTGLARAPSTTLVPPDPGGIFGVALTGAGDVNGDGYADLIVGAPGNFDSDHTGRAYVYLGGPDGLATSPATTLVGPDGPGGTFGWQVTSAGDVDGDGYADVAVSASNATGAVYVFLGGPDGTHAAYATRLVGPDGASGWFGRSLASVGDLDGDGHEELAVGGSHHVYVFSGSASGFATAPKQLPPPTSDEPCVLAGADFDGDGYADLADDLQIYPGSATGIADTPALTITDAFANGPIAAAGDLDGDGYADFAVGAPVAWCDNNMDDCGAVFVYAGGPSGLSTTHAAIADPALTFFDNFGEAVAGAGDIDGDGFDDLVACSPSHDGSTGFAAVFAGASTGVTQTFASIVVGPDGVNGGFGTSLY